MYALAFYKSCTRNQRLRGKTQFKNEGVDAGADAGALKAEFFGSLMKCVDEELFEVTEVRLG